jgi:predicted DsbA family dithiol-disulfide isomerase
MKKTLPIDVWSDIVCPWCAIGKRRLESALEGFAHRDDVKVVWRAFELDPSAPKVREGNHAEQIAKKYGRTKAQVEAMIQSVTDTAAKDGLDFHLSSARAGNTFDGHRVLHLAAERGLQDAVKERFFRGYMSEGLAIGDHEVLVRLASEAGLDAQEVRAVLASDRYARDVREEEEAARRFGITGVPFFVLAGKFAISGAQPAHVIAGALERAWASLPEPEQVEGAGDVSSEGAVCGPDGCA